MQAFHFAEVRNSALHVLVPSESRKFAKNVLFENWERERQMMHVTGFFVYRNGSLVSPKRVIKFVAMLAFDCYLAFFPHFPGKAGKAETRWNSSTTRISSSARTFT